MEKKRESIVATLIRRSPINTSYVNIVGRYGKKSRLTHARSLSFSKTRIRVCQTELSENLQSSSVGPTLRNRPLLPATVASFASCLEHNGRRAICDTI